MRKGILLLLSIIGMVALVACVSGKETDYAAAIMVEGEIYMKTVTAIPTEIDESAIVGYTSSYTDKFPKKDGETNFCRETGKPYARVEDGIAIRIGNEWYLCTPMGMEQGGNTEFLAVIDESILNQFEDSTELKKVYILRTDDWFATDEISNFSQVATTEVVYVVPGGEEDMSNDKAYSFYDVNEDGKIEWNSSAYPPSDAPTPFGFSGLTYEMIDNALDEIEYEDYIITYAQRLNTVFVWVRCESVDKIIAYPTRPDLLGLEVGGLYTLEEVKCILADAYAK